MGLGQLVASFFLSAEKGCEDRGDQWQTNRQRSSRVARGERVELLEKCHHCTLESSILKGTGRERVKILEVLGGDDGQPTMQDIFGQILNPKMANEIP